MQGYQCEMYDNPADFALDSLIEAGRKSGELEKLNEAYKSSPMHINLPDLSSKHSQNDDNLERLRRQQEGGAARSIGIEIYYVSQRTLKNAIRSPESLLAQIMNSILMSLLVGVVFFNLQRTTDPGIQNYLGALFFIVMNQVFGTLSSLEPLIKERTLFIHVSIFYRKIFLKIPFIVGKCQWLLSNYNFFHCQTSL
jgi:ATP-binding cassette subfamily G (WHITE) protein 2